MKESQEKLLADMSDEELDAAIEKFQKEFEDSGKYGNLAAASYEKFKRQQKQSK